MRRLNSYSDIQGNVYKIQDVRFYSFSYCIYGRNIIDALLAIGVISNGILFLVLQFDTPFVFLTLLLRVKLTQTKAN